MIAKKTVKDNSSEHEDQTPLNDTNGDMGSNDSEADSTSQIDEDNWADAKDSETCYGDNEQSLQPSAAFNRHVSTSSNNRNTANSSTPSSDNLSLHEAVFNNDSQLIYELLKNKKNAKLIVNQRDKHGNTALHLACMLGRSKEIITALLQSGAAVDSKNLNRWTPFHEACSYGNRDIVILLTKQLENDVHDALSKAKLSEVLEKTKDYRLVLKWEFQSWVPFLTRVLPSDVCVITKQGKCIRIDTRLLDFEVLSWRKGDCCLIYSSKFKKKWIVMNNKTKKYQHFESAMIDKNIEVKADEFMSSDLIDIELKSADIQFNRTTCGWIWKADKMEKVGNYEAALYNFNNVYLVTKKRREHLKDEDIKRNKTAYKALVYALKFGKRPNQSDLDEISDKKVDEPDIESLDEEDGGEAQHRESLPPPPTTNVTWEEYCQAEPGNFPTLGREPKCKITKTAVKASVAMSREFPLSKNEFVDLLSVVPLKLFKKLKEFVELRLPEGFPIRVDIPIFSFLNARITFEDFAFLNTPVDESLFDIPKDYEEDPNLFPFFSRNTKLPETDG